MRRAQHYDMADDAIMYRDEDIPEDEMEMMPAYDHYVIDQMTKPEYRRIKIGLDRVERSLGAIASGCRPVSREQMLTELGYVLARLQEVETLAEKVEDTVFWEYVIDHIEMLEDIRRHMVAELRWELQSDRHCPVEA